VTAEENKIETVAKNSKPPDSRALARCILTWYLAARRKRSPSMTTYWRQSPRRCDAFTRVYCPASNAVRAMTSRVQVSERGVEHAPTVSPVCRHGFGGVLSSAASGMIASKDSTKQRIALLV